MKWSKSRSKFKVKVTYREGKTRGVIAIPAPILRAWDWPDYIEITSVVQAKLEDTAGQDGDAILTPINDA